MPSLADPDWMSMSKDMQMIFSGVMPVTIVSIEGTIGMGKSTALQQLKESPAKLAALIGEENFAQLPKNALYVLFQEPVEAWKHCGETNLLAEFYKNKKATAFLFEIHVLHTRSLLVDEAIAAAVKDHGYKTGDRMPEGIVLLQERSLHSCRAVFAKMLYQDGTLTDAEWRTYNNVYQVYKKQTMRICDFNGRRFDMRVIRSFSIYVDFPPEEALVRIVSRNRPGEVTDGKSDISLEYLHALRAQHQEVFNTVPTGVADKKKHICVSHDKFTQMFPKN